MQNFNMVNIYGKNKPNLQTGFTMIELVIVIVLLSILVAGAILMWPGSGLSLDAQAKRMVGDIRYAQALAMSAGDKYQVVIIPSSKRYQIKDSAGNTVTLPTGGAADVTLPASATMAVSNLSGNLLVFGSDGRPYTDTAGTLLTTTATITLSWSGVGFTKVISIVPDTGRVVSS